MLRPAWSIWVSGLPCHSASQIWGHRAFGESYLCHKALGGLTVLLGGIGDEDQIGIAFVKITLASSGE